jgi:hypothetical protein
MSKANDRKHFLFFAFAFCFIKITANQLLFVRKFLDAPKTSLLQYFSLQSSPLMSLIFKKAQAQKLLAANQFFTEESRSKATMNRSLFIVFHCQ